MNKPEYLYIVTNTDGAIVFRGEREAAYEVAANGSLLTVRPIEADKAFFEVSAEWMNKTGNGNKAQIFPVVLVESNRVGGQGFHAFAILDTSGFPAMFSKSWTVAVGRGRFVSHATPDGAAVASYGKGKHVGYSEDGKFVVSFPAQLNGGRVPELDDVPGILAGQSVAAACTVFNKANIVRLAERMNANSLDWCALPGNDDDEFILRADLDGIFIVDGSTGERFERVADSWATENARIQAERAAAPVVSLAKPEEAAAPVLVAAPGAPVESNADTMARAVAFVRGRRLAQEARESCECHQCAVPVAGLDDGADDTALL